MTLKRRNLPDYCSIYKWVMIVRYFMGKGTYSDFKSFQSCRRQNKQANSERNIMILFQNGKSFQFYWNYNPDSLPSERLLIILEVFPASASRRDRPLAQQSGFSLLLLLFQGRMGNNPNGEVMPAAAAAGKEDQQSCTFSTGSAPLAGKNPLHLYVNYRSPMPIRTLTSLKRNSNQTVPCKRLVTEPSDLADPSQKQQTKENSDILAPSESMKKKKPGTEIEKLTVLHKSDNAVRKQQRESLNIDKTKPIEGQYGFKSIKINLEQFLVVKKQPVSQYYEMKEMIGEGSFGQVFRAYCKKTRQQRAIKVLKTKFMRDNKRKQFLAEMTLLSKINHPSIITLYDLFEHNNSYFVVMEYCKGGSIVDLINKFKRKSERIIANIVKQLLSALAYLHSVNIVHRDIKLDNIVFLDKIEEAEEEFIPIKIIDFGTAVETKFKIIQNYPISGTLSYLAPEVMRGTLTEKSDIWSSAVLMTILLTGMSPFKGKYEAETKMNIGTKQLQFEDSPLKYLSDEAKSLLKAMFDRNYHKRIGASEALKHPWFNFSRIRQSINLGNIQMLQKYYRSNNLISVVQSFLSLKKINQQQRQKLANFFNEIDSDNNGLIEAGELISIYKNNFEDYSEEEVKAILNSIDKNQSGKIDFNEFMIAMYSREKLFIKESLSEAFDYFDRDRTGFLEKSELKEILKGSQNEEIEYFIGELDTDKDHKISREEFVNYLTKF